MGSESSEICVRAMNGGETYFDPSMPLGAVKVAIANARGTFSTNVLLVEATNGKVVTAVDCTKCENLPSTLLSAVVPSVFTDERWIQALREHGRHRDAATVYEAIKEGRSESGASELLHCAFMTETSYLGELARLFEDDDYRDACIDSFLAIGIDVGWSNHEGRTALCGAAQCGHLGAVNHLLAQGAVASGRSLMDASSSGQKVIVDRLLAAKADVHYSDSNGYTSLFFACKGLHTEIVDQLLDAQANIDHANMWEETCLWQACTRGDMEVVDVLIARKADVNVTIANHITPLLTAAENGDVGIVEKLVASKAILREKGGHRAIIEAAKYGHVDVLSSLLEAGGTAFTDTCDEETGRSVVTTAALSGYADAVRVLIEARVNVNKCDGHGFGETALSIAAIGGYAEIVRLLLDANADVEEPDREGRRALNLAVLGGHADVVQILVDAKADVTKCDEQQENSGGYNALTMAARSGDADVVRILIDARADWNAPDQNGFSVLTLAATYGHADVVQLLIQHGVVDVDQPDALGTLPITLAGMHEHTEVVDILIAAGAKTSDDCSIC